MGTRPRTRLVPSTATNMVALTNELIVQNARKGQDTEIELPAMIDRAYMIFHETALLPMVDYDDTPVKAEV